MRSLGMAALMLADMTMPLALSREQLAARNPRLASQILRMPLSRQETVARRIVAVAGRAPDQMTQADATALMGAMSRRLKRAGRMQRVAAAGGIGVIAEPVGEAA